MQQKGVILVFIATAAIGFLPATYLVCSTEQLELHQLLNGQQDQLFDPLFQYGTHLADGLVPLIVSVLLLLVQNVRSALLVGIATGLSGLFTQLLKRFFEHDRPFMFLERMPELRLLEGVDLAHHFSFPSGHATAAFSLCFALALITGKRWMSMILAFMACLLAYTRVWISQHFLVDVLVGATIGMVVTQIAFWFLYRSGWAQERPWLVHKLLRSKRST